MRARPVLALVVLAACGAPPRQSPPERAATDAAAPAMRATVRWTSDGVPHVRADDWAGLGYGQGWAMASLHLCVLADQVVRVRGERARFFGAGADDANIDSDFFHRHVGYRERAKAALPRLSTEAQALVKGFAAGYSRYVTRTPSSKWPQPCRGAEWVRPIDELDLVAHALAISTIASSRVFETMIARAAPRTGKEGHTRAPLPERSDALASNGWALGAERTAHKGGLVVANPHFPWDGELMFYESHLTIPGELDVYGAALVGMPLVNIGWNDKVAWTHTFSSSVRFVLYRLSLVPGQPLRWRHGDEIRPIVGASHTIDVREPDGTMRAEKRTLYRTSLGPMLDSNDLPWDTAAGTAFVLRDVALGVGEGYETYLGLARAKNLDGVETALAKGGTPFVNTMAADASGEVLYADATRVPALRADALIAWQIGRKTMPALEAAWRKRVVILDGSRPMFDLASDDPSAPGAVAYADAPKLRRRDVVINANDSYRFTHPTVQLPAASPLYGDDAGRPSPRTLMNLRHVAAGTPDAGDDGAFDRAEAVAAILSNRSYSALALREDVVARCRGAAPTGKTGKATRRVKQVRPKVPTGDARPLCEVLARWDGRFAVDSRGAALWREFLVELAADDQLPWARPYAPDDRTSAWGLEPRVDSAAVVAALGRARTRLADAGVAPDAPLGELQRTARGEAMVGVPGGTSRDGVANVVKWVDWNGTLLPRQRRGTPRSDSGLDAGGWPINYGTSFVMAVELSPDAAPRADVLLTYGNSTDPASSRYRDQLEAFAAGRLRPARFTEADITADRGLVTEELSSP